MNHEHIKAILDGVVPQLKTFMQPLIDRLEALEKRIPESGEKGDPGQDGAAGRDGTDGVDGKDGAPGRDGEPGPAGERGADGKDGEPGQPGEKGLDGLQGKEGAPGRDGRDGLPGVQGEKGLDGTNGSNGIDGKDGFGFDDIVVEHDGERGFTFRFVRGDQVKEFGKFTIPATIFRGVWKDGDYQHGDQVTWGGSQFIAKRDTKEKPGEASDDWQLSCKRGDKGNSAYETARKLGFHGTERDWLNTLKGSVGPKGERGEQGPRAYGG